MYLDDKKTDSRGNKTKVAVGVWFVLLVTNLREATDH